MEKPEDTDPELALMEMQETAREAANDLIPVLMEKAINGKTKDALNIFEAFADRSGFTKPEKNTGQTGPLIQLNLNANDMGGMLQGLKTITQGNQNGPSVQNADDIQDAVTHTGITDA